jgi:hypothetical protein
VQKLILVALLCGGCGFGDDDGDGNPFRKYIPPPVAEGNVCKVGAPDACPTAGTAGGLFKLHCAERPAAEVSPQMARMGYTGIWRPTEIRCP